MNLSLLWIALRALGFYRIPSAVWADRGSGTRVGEQLLITDINGGTFFYWIGTIWKPVGGRISWSSAADSSVTRTVDETVLGTVSLPAGLVPANATIQASALYNYTNSASTKTMRIRLGGIAGAAYFSQAATTTLSVQQMAVIRCITTGTQKAQTGAVPAFTAAQSSTANTTSSVDMTANTTIVFTGQNTNTGETVTVRGYVVEIIFP